MQVLHLPRGRMDCASHISSTLRLPHQRSTSVASCSYSTSSTRVERHKQKATERPSICALRCLVSSQSLFFSATRRSVVAATRSRAQQGAEGWETPGMLALCLINEVIQGNGRCSHPGLNHAALAITGDSTLRWTSCISACVADLHVLMYDIVDGTTPACAGPPARQTSGLGKLESLKIPRQTRQRVEDAVESLGGRVTVGDVSSRAGLTLGETERTLNALAADSEGTLQVACEQPCHDASMLVCILAACTLPLSCRLLLHTYSGQPSALLHMLCPRSCQSRAC